MLTAARFTLFTLVISMVSSVASGAASPESVANLAITKMNAAASVIDARLEVIVSATKNKLTSQDAKGANDARLTKTADTGKALVDQRSLAVRSSVIAASRAGIKRLEAIRREANRKGDTATVTASDAAIAAVQARRDELAGDAGVIAAKATTAKGQITAHLQGLLGTP